MSRKDSGEDRDTAIDPGSCPCTGSASSCLPCEGLINLYWCETCQQDVPEKRCPTCGLKARKIRTPS